MMRTNKTVYKFSDAYVASGRQDNNAPFLKNEYHIIIKENNDTTEAIGFYYRESDDRTLTNLHNFKQIQQLTPLVAEAIGHLEYTLLKALGNEEVYLNTIFQNDSFTKYYK